MNKDKKKTEISLGTPGAASLMVIFAVLCLAVFAVLSLSTALADSRLEHTAADTILKYYHADAAAEEYLSELRAKRENGEYDYSIPVSDTQILSVRARIDEDGYNILKWQLEYSADWEADESMNVWNGE